MKGIRSARGSVKPANPQDVLRRKKSTAGSKILVVSGLDDVDEPQLEVRTPGPNGRRADGATVFSVNERGDLYFAGKFAVPLFFGDGSEGDGLLSSGSAEIIARDYFYKNLTISNSTTLLTGAPAALGGSGTFRLFCAGVLDIGTDSNIAVLPGDGANGVDGGAGGIGSAAGTVSGCVDGGAGGNGGADGSAGTSQSAAALGGAGGGGRNVIHLGGAGGAIVAPTNVMGSPHDLISYLTGLLLGHHGGSNFVTPINAGAGGGGGAGVAAGFGGGGGSSGGILLVAARKVILRKSSGGGACLHAAGGNGGLPSGVGAGAGGGGGGGAILLTAGELVLVDGGVLADYCDVLGGLVGTGGTGGANGAPGQVLLYQ